METYNGSHDFFYISGVNIWFTFDYELFFGNPTGTIEKCLLEPTERLMAISKKYNAPFTYFVDAGFLFKLSQWGQIYPQLAEQHSRISQQLKALIALGNDIQLHIHPHWELSTYEDGAWDIPQDRGYRMDEFSQEEAAVIFRNYKNHLEEIIGRNTIAYRAGGWCIQPFEHIKQVFLETGMHYDSSVVPGMKFEAGVYNIDFSNASIDKDSWCFDADPVTINRNGRFVEIPISGHYYTPLFYWQLYILGKLNKSRHKFVGDGNYIPQPGRKWKTLTQSQWNHVSCDGYFSKKLKSTTKNFLDRRRSHLVIIGHPKSMTAYSFDKLERYMQKFSGKVTFQTFSQYHDQTR